MNTKEVISEVRQHLNYERSLGGNAKNVKFDSDEKGLFIRIDIDEGEKM